jgi:hypothetical protein
MREGIFEKIPSLKLSHPKTFPLKEEKMESVSGFYRKRQLLQRVAVDVDPYENA